MRVNFEEPKRDSTKHKKEKKSKAIREKSTIWSQRPKSIDNLKTLSPPGYTFVNLTLHVA